MIYQKRLAKGQPIPKNPYNDSDRNAVSRALKKIRIKKMALSKVPINGKLKG